LHANTCNVHFIEAVIKSNGAMADLHRWIDGARCVCLDAVLVCGFWLANLPHRYPKRIIAMSTLRETDRSRLFSLLLRLIVALEVLVYFGAVLLHLGIRIPLGPIVLAVPNPILPASIVETILGIAAVINLAVLMRARRSPTRITLGIHLFLLAGVALGMISLFFRVGPPPNLNWTIHYVMLATIAVVMALLALRGARV
jgi:hypothetical protein